MNPDAKLSKREEEIAGYIAWGSSAEDIAEMLFISKDTVKNTIKNLKVKIDCRKSTEISAWYFCTHFHIPLDFSPLRRKIIACILLIILIPSELISATQFIRARSMRQVVRTVRRPVRRRNDYDTSELFLTNS